MIEEKPDNEKEMNVENIGEDTDLESWLILNKIEVGDIRINLYRFLNPTVSKEKATVDVIHGRIPDDNEIGMTYGSGKYFMVVQKPRVKATTRTFWIDKVYDERRKQKEFTVPPSNNHNTIIQPDNTAFFKGIELAMGMQNSLLNTFLPLLLKNNDNKPVNAGGNNIQEAIGTYNFLKNILQSNLQENTKLFSDMQRRIINNEPDNNDETEEKSGLDKLLSGLSQLAPLITTLLPQNKAANTAQTIVQAAPAIHTVAKQVQEQIPVKKPVMQSKKPVKPQQSTKSGGNGGPKRIQ